MSNKIFLYTPWCEQGLSYDAKVIEEIAIRNGLDVFITFNKKRKIQWPCKFLDINNIVDSINQGDYFFCFERIPEKQITSILEKTENIYLMINYEYYEKELVELYKKFKVVFCKSTYALNQCKIDGLNNIKYMPWILWDFPISEIKPISDKIKIVFNGGTGGYKDRRNLQSIINLFKDYTNDNVDLTIKLTNSLRRWTKRILYKNRNFVESDNRISLIQDTFDRSYYMKFLKSYDINLCPSKYEGFGLTILEGLHSRLASVTIDQPPMNETVINSFNGICIKNHPVDKIRSQGIYDVDRQDFYNQFKKLVNNEATIMSMKKKTKDVVIKNINNFNDYFIKEIK